VAEQPRSAGHTEDHISQPSLGEHGEPRWGGAVASPADEEMRLGPVALERSQEPADNHRVLGACGTLAWPEAGGPQGRERACANAQRQIARALVVMVIAGHFLLALGRTLGVIPGQHKGSGGLGSAGETVGAQRPREPGAILAVDAVFQPGTGRGTRQVLGGRARLRFNRGVCRRLWVAWPSAALDALG
jgi:hypothetical protein